MVAPSLVARRNDHFTVLFDYPDRVPGLRVVMSGRSSGPCNPHGCPDRSVVEPADWEYNWDNTTRIVALCRGLRSQNWAPGKIFVGRPGFWTDRCFNPRSDDVPMTSWSNHAPVYRVRESADALLLDDLGQSAAFCTADCLTGAVYHPRSPRLVVMHLGLRCLVPTNPSQKSLLEFVVDTKFSDVNRDELVVWLGGGARGCCFGYDPESEYGHQVLTDIQSRCPEALGEQVQKGPRKGQSSIDPLVIAYHQCLRLGILETSNIFFSGQCTSCAGDPTDDKEGLTYSNLRQVLPEQKITKGRNLMIVTLG